MAQEIACGLKYLHDNGVVHGDLKVDNILVSEDEVAQITDFGIARILGVQGYTTLTQRNIRFAAPELRPLTDDLSNVRPTTASDIYSLGILFLQLFHGPDNDPQRGLPYNHIRYSQHTNDYMLLTRIHQGERPFRNHYNFIPDRYWFLMENCWAHNPADRPHIGEVFQALFQ